MPKTTTFNIIFWLVFSHSIASGTLDVNQSILDDAAGQINTAEAEIQAQINLLISDLKSSHDHLAYGLSEYCGIEENDPSCAGKDQITIASENSVIIDKMMWGFVLNGDESDTETNKKDITKKKRITTKTNINNKTQNPNIES
jgi:hypothetical protein